MLPFNKDEITTEYECFCHGNNYDESRAIIRDVVFYVIYDNVNNIQSKIMTDVNGKAMYPLEQAFITHSQHEMILNAINNEIERHLSDERESSYNRKMHNDNCV